MAIHLTRRYGIFMALLVGFIFVAIGMKKLQESANLFWILLALLGAFFVYLGLKDSKKRKYD